MKLNTSIHGLAAVLIFGAFSNPASADIFRFNSIADGTEGWTIDGVYDGDSDTLISGSSDPASYMFRLGGESYDVPFGRPRRIGCIVVRHPGSCFPAKASSGFASYDLVSPRLFSHHDLESYRFVVRTNMPGVWVQPLLEVRDGSGGTSLLREVTSSGGGVFHELTSGADWERITFTRPGDLSEKVVKLRIRVFVENGTLAIYGGMEASVYLDYVCIDPS